MPPRGTRSPPSNGRGSGPARKSGKPGNHRDAAPSLTGRTRIESLAPSGEHSQRAPAKAQAQAPTVHAAGGASSTTLLAHRSLNTWVIFRAYRRVPVVEWEPVSMTDFPY